MPYYDGRWHLYSEAERRAYGQRKREELSKQWHAKWITRHRLKVERLWTDKAIATFLGKPRDAGPVKAWTKAAVMKAELKPAFVAWMEKRRAILIQRGKLPAHHQLEPLGGYPDNVVSIDRARQSREQSQEEPDA